MIEQENKSWTKSVVLLNLVIFFIYFIVGAVAAYFDNGFDWLSEIALWGYLVHAVLLILIALFKFISGLIKKQSSNAGQYMLAVLLLLLVGFGSCTAVFSLMGGL